MLETTKVEEMHVNVEFKRIVAEIYSFVISAQVKYCRMNMTHPFLEQTYLNIALFNRSMKKFAESLMMWRRLESLQRELYGEGAILMLYTYKNIGTCYLGLGKSEDARKSFEECIDLIKAIKSDTPKPEHNRRDQEEIANLEQNKYLTYVSDREYEKAIECTEASLKIISTIYGERSKKLAAKWYQKASSCLTLRRTAEAIKNIETAIDLQTNPTPDTVYDDDEKEGGPPKVSEEATNFNRIQFQNFLSSSLYMHGQDFDRVMVEA